jgi:hypothetical protein
VNKRFQIALTDQTGSFPAIVSGTPDTDLYACFIDDLYNIILLEVSDDSGDTYQ